MTLKVIGAGFGRTGTVSLKAALEELGFGPCYHMIELLKHPAQIDQWEAASQGKAVDWDALLTGYQAIVDFPGCLYYKALMQRYPEAKVLLSVRDPDQWYDSTYHTIYQAKPGLGPMLMLLLRVPFSVRVRRFMRIFRMADRVLWHNLFQDRFADRQHALAVYQRHIAEVKQVVPADRLLVYNVAEGWTPLCNFLEVAVPVGKPFPRLNDRASFPQWSQQLINLALQGGTAAQSSHA